MYIAKPKKVLIAAGSTGGHLFPALSLGIDLRTRYGCEIVLLVNERSVAFIDRHVSYDFTFVKVRSIRNKWNVFRVFFAIVNAMRILCVHRPNAIVGFGSSITFPVVFAGWCMKIPRLIHEQNAEFGLANDVARHISNRVALTFPIAYVEGRKKYIVTGNILRPEINLAVRSKKSYSQRRLDPARVLVIGGSQGSQAINNVIVQMLSLMSSEDVRRITLYHLIGHKADEKSFIEAYRDCAVKAYVWRFSNDIGKLYSIADIAITRAGAGTVSELIEFAIPSVLVPYPYAQNHQLQNAQYIESHKGGVIIEEKDLSPERLKETLLSLLSEKEQCRNMHAALKQLQKGKTVAHISNIVIQLIKEGNSKKKS